MKKKALLAFVSTMVAFILFLTGCTDGSENENAAQNANNATQGTDNAAQNTDNTAQDTLNATIKSVFPEKFPNNPNNYLASGSLASDDDYVYFIAKKEQSSGTSSDKYALFKMKKNTGEKESIFENDTQSYSVLSHDLYVYNGYLYECGSSGVLRINLSTLEVENDFIQLPVADDIKRGDTTYYAYTSLQYFYIVDNLLIYTYEKGYSGTSSNEATYTEVYNLDTSETTKLELDFTFKKLTSDGENLYLYDNGIKVVPVSELKAGNSIPQYKNIAIKNQDKIKYIASNGLVVELKNGDIAFYSFDDCRDLENGAEWKSETVIGSSQDNKSIFGKSEWAVYLMNENNVIAYKNASNSLQVYAGTNKITEEKKLDQVYARGAVDNDVYVIGYDDGGNFVCMIADLNGEVEEIKQLKEESTETAEITEPVELNNDYIDINEQEYDAQNGIVIRNSGYSISSKSTQLSLTITNTTDTWLRVMIDGKLIINNSFEIDASLVSNKSYVDIYPGDNKCTVTYYNSDVAEQNNFSSRVETVQFKLNFSSYLDFDEPMDFTTPYLMCTIK